ncbi:mechanosensitive ion channel protein 8-like [Juglans microcarpa x Juglans regia]|uniref:mechanosensitive ion channel protein 8-like n=1 Tax=Juglans microcarpa x Juglans regia TaxID=2249226 RepID=UPI001B7DFCB5|nr:mechanosensitive ion channel protein 8-like [Juglans microcarpa x Juglans regia]
MRAVESSEHGEVVVKIDEGDSNSKDVVDTVKNDKKNKICRESSYVSGEMSLDMDELRPNHRNLNLPSVTESPEKPQMSKELNISNVGVEAADDNYVRHRNKEPSYDREQQPQSQQCRDGGSGDLGGEEVRSCTSNASFQRKSSLSRAKTKSRLMDPREELERRSERVPRSGQLPGLPPKALEEDEDDPFWEDLPDEYRKTKLSALTVLEFVSLVVIIAFFICSLFIPYLKEKNLWKLKLWKWQVLILVLICGRLFSVWGIRILVFFIERNFVLRKRVLYFVYGVRKAVQNCLWLGLVLLAWHFLFDKKVERESKSDKLKYVTKVLLCLLSGTLVWLVKTLMVKVLASSFHVSTYFDRIQESLFTQYVIETLSGPPLSEIRNAEEEEARLSDEVNKLQNAGATVPHDLKATAFPPPKSGRVIGSSGLLPRSSGVKNDKLYQAMPKKGDDQGISIDHLHKLNPKNVSAWNMKRLMRIVRNGTPTTADEQILDATNEDGSNTQIRSELEAKAAAKKIFQNVARHGAMYIYLEDLMRFLREDEALKTVGLFEGAFETRRISKSSLNNWVVNVFRERRALALTLNDTKTAVNVLHRGLNVLVSIAMLVICLLILGIATTKFLLFLSSQLLLVAFIFGSTCKALFEAIIFIFVMHPFDVGDRCEIEGVQMVVEKMNILTTVFLRYDNAKVFYPNSVLCTKPINNFYRSPEMGDAIEFYVHISTPAEKIATIKHRIISYVEGKEEHWYPAPMFVFMNMEELNRVKLAVWLTHRMSHQDMGERWVRRSLLVEEMVKILIELDIHYRLLPVDINIRTMPHVSSTQLPCTWTTTSTS